MAPYQNISGGGRDGGGSSTKARLDTTGGQGGASSQDLQSGVRRQLDTTKSFRCLQCTTLKLRCSRGMPCERCFRLSLRCAPPSEAYLVTPAAAVEKIGVASPLLELVFRNVDPAKMAQCAMGVFMDWLQGERIDRGVALATIRGDRARSRQLGVDYTHGIMDAVVRALGLTMVDLEDPMELRYEPRRPPLLEGAGGAVSGSSSSGALLAEAARLRAAVEGSTAWRFLSGPGLPVSASVYLSIPSAVHTVILGKGGFLGTAQVFTGQQMRRASAPLLVAGLVAPDDVRSWFEVMLSGVFTDNTQPCSRFVKMMDATGEINLFLIKSQRVFVEEAGVMGRYIIIEPMPASRHIRPNPSHPHRVIHTYRHTPTPGEPLLGGGGQQQEAPAWMVAATAAGGTAGFGERHGVPATNARASFIPGLAAVPVPPPTLPIHAPSPALARSTEPVARPLAPEDVQAGFRALCSTIASGLSGRSATGGAPPPGLPPSSTAAGALVQMKEEEEDDSEEAQALLWAALGVLEGDLDVPVFDEEALEATWTQELA